MGRRAGIKRASKIRRAGGDVVGSMAGVVFLGAHIMRSIHDLGRPSVIGLTVRRESARRSTRTYEGDGGMDGGQSSEQEEEAASAGGKYGTGGISAGRGSNNSNGSMAVARKAAARQSRSAKAASNHSLPHPWQQRKSMISAKNGVAKEAAYLLPLSHGAWAWHHLILQYLIALMPA